MMLTKYLKKTILNTQLRINLKKKVRGWVSTAVLKFPSGGYNFWSVFWLTSTEESIQNALLTAFWSSAITVWKTLFRKRWRNTWCFLQSHSKKSYKLGWVSNDYGSKCGNGLHESLALYPKPLVKVCHNYGRANFGKFRFTETKFW